MHYVVSFFGWLLAAAAVLLLLLGVLSWPPGGLMFALPYVFWLLAAVTALPAAGLVWLGRRLRRRSAEEGG